MIVLTTNAANEIYCTPYENADGVIWDFFILRFTNRTTQSVVEILEVEDVSTTLRYQKFLIDVAPFNSSTLFEDEINGFWSYEIYGSIGGITPNTPALETGYMLLKNSTNFEPMEYNEQSNTFKAYNG
jgi:hypothetical protein